MDKTLRIIFIVLCLIGAIVAVFTCIHALFGDEPITIVKEWIAAGSFVGSGLFLIMAMEVIKQL